MILEGSSAAIQRSRARASSTRRPLGGTSWTAKSRMSCGRPTPPDCSKPPEPAMVLTGTLRRYAQMAEVLCEPERGEGTVAEGGSSADAQAAKAAGALYSS